MDDDADAVAVMAEKQIIIGLRYNGVGFQSRNTKKAWLRLGNTTLNKFVENWATLSHFDLVKARSAALAHRLVILREIGRKIAIGTDTNGDLAANMIRLAAAYVVIIDGLKRIEEFPTANHVVLTLTDIDRSDFGYPSPNVLFKIGETDEFELPELDRINVWADQIGFAKRWK